MRCPECQGSLDPWKIRVWMASGPPPKKGHQCSACNTKFFEYTAPNGQSILLNLSKRHPGEPMGEWVAVELRKWHERRRIN